MGQTNLLNTNYFSQVIIVGGGLAGLISAIHLSKKGIEVLLIEKNPYPMHKVCGEYISNEVLPYLLSLDFDPFQFGANKISKFLMTSPNGKEIRADLPLGGFGISRFTLDCELAKLARLNGVTIVHDKVTDITFLKNSFKIITKRRTAYNSGMVLGAYGKRSSIDLKLQRSRHENGSAYFAVKAHYRGEFQDNLVSLHNFNGGYCGVSKIEKGLINICYIAKQQSLKKYKNLDDFQQSVLYQNKYLKRIFESSELCFSKPISIGQISFSAKNPVQNHVLMCGDTAGMIHPLSGNGMGMAIHSAQIISSMLVSYFKAKIKSREELEMQYSTQWKMEFSQRLKMGKNIAGLLGRNNISNFLISGLKTIPGLLPIIIKKTHGSLLKEIAM